MENQPRYVSVGLDELQVGEPLPVTVFVYLDHRFLAFRAQGTAVERDAFERLDQKRVTHLFVLEGDAPAFHEWAVAWKKRDGVEADSQMGAGRSPGSSPELTEQDAVELRRVQAAKEQLRRRALDIFRKEPPSVEVGQVLHDARDFVMRMMKLPFAVKPLTQLQSVSRTVVDHSLNVSLLSTYLGLRMGYNHQGILTHLCTGALLHDVGKALVQVPEDADLAFAETKMAEHASLGLSMLSDDAPREVKMIVVQHHESFDGKGYPQGLKGQAIYDLARIVSIANVFDDLVSAGSGSLEERQRRALRSLDEIHFKSFDPQKLDKVLRILAAGV
jgi:putative nucleotidyltransferase with HDIG domain